jgi:predicted transcriptional regulator
MTEQLYKTIESQPGQTIGVLAATMGCGSRDLRVSIRNLITQGRVSKAGARMNTTYFPMDGDRDLAS